MKLDKAINTLSAMLEDYEGDEFPNQENAIQLGIVALIRLQYMRKFIYTCARTPLPGEDPPNAKELSPEEIKRLRESPIGEK